VNRTLPKISTAWFLTLLVAGVGAVLLVAAMRDTLAKAPSRDATAELGPYGLVTIRFSTVPNPPLPTGTVTLSFMPMDARQRTIVVDGIAFEYGREGEDQPVGSGEAQRMSDGSGMFTPALALSQRDKRGASVAGAQFPDVGNWWVRTTVIRGDVEAEVRFTFCVKPAQ